MLKIIFGILIVISIISVPSTFAHPHAGQIMINGHTHQPNHEYLPINGMIGLEKTTLLFHSPEDNKLPWGFVEGKIANHVAGYPVIIQIFQEDKAKHFAQVNVTDDGKYEHKFRVLNIEDEHKSHIFSGDYTVVIFKVVYLNSQV